MSSYDLDRATQAFRRGYWDGYCGRAAHHMPPYALLPAQEEYRRGHRTGRADKREAFGEWRGVDQWGAHKIA